MQTTCKHKARARWGDIHIFVQIRLFYLARVCIGSLNRNGKNTRLFKFLKAGIVAVIDKCLKIVNHSPKVFFMCPIWLLMNAPTSLAGG